MGNDVPTLFFLDPGFLAFLVIGGGALVLVLVIWSLIDRIRGRD